MPVSIAVAVAVILRIVSNPVANVFQKKLTAGRFHPLLVNAATYTGLSVLCVVQAFSIPWLALPSAFWIFSMLGGLAGAVGNGFLVKALQKGELSVLGPVNAYKSVVGLVIGMLVLGELPNAWGLLGTILIIAGSYPILHTPAERFSWQLLKRKEIQFRFWALLLTAIEAVLIKKVILISNVTVSFVAWCWWGCFFSVLLLPFGGMRPVVRPLSWQDGGNYLGLLLCIGTMQLSTNFVFEHIAVGYALALFQLSALVTVFLGYQFFQEKDLKKKLVGSLVMIAGSVVIILLK